MQNYSTLERAKIIAMAQRCAETLDAQELIEYFEYGVEPKINLNKSVSSLLKEGYVIVFDNRKVDIGKKPKISSCPCENPDEQTGTWCIRCDKKTKTKI